MTSTAVDATRVAWERADTYPLGSERKVLHRDSDGQPRAVILKLPAGFEMDQHSHVMTEHHYVLDGEVDAGGERLVRGSYQLIPTRSVHGPFRSERGAEILVIWTD
jgi:anti-sigma factor ChrR (cupin superfamily)